MRPRTIILLILSLLFIGCDSAVRKEARGFTQGTTYKVIYYSPQVDLQYQIDSLLLRFDRALSTYQQSSYISRWNSNKALSDTQPPLFREVVKRALEINRDTDGAFDITVSPLMQYWFGTDRGTNGSDSSAVDSIRQHVGMDLIVLNKDGYGKKDSMVQLDVNAIAQGYSVDVLAYYLQSCGIYDYLVEIGGEVRANGTKENGAAWKVEVDRPTEERIVGLDPLIAVELNNSAMATSGNYRKFVVVDGRKLGHSLDPRTGYPATTDVLSATVIAPDCMTADALATAIMVGGREFGMDLISSDNRLEGVLIHSGEDGLETWVSEGVIGPKE